MCPKKRVRDGRSQKERHLLIQKWLVKFQHLALDWSSLSHTENSFGTEEYIWFWKIFFLQSLDLLLILFWGGKIYLKQDQRSYKVTLKKDNSQVVKKRCATKLSAYLHDSVETSFYLISNHLSQDIDPSMQELSVHAHQLVCLDHDMCIKMSCMIP